MNNSLPTINKRILIDVTFLFDQYYKRGIGRYGKETLKRLLPDIIQDGNWDIHLIGFLDLEQNLVRIELSSLLVEQLEQIITFHSLGEPTLSTISNKKNWFRLFQPIINTVRPDLYFTFHFARGLPTLTQTDKTIHFRPKTAVVAHDAIPFQTNSFSNRSLIHNIIKKRFFKFMWSGVQHTDLVITPSQYSKEKIIEFGKVAKDNIAVVYLGVDAKFYRNTKEYDQHDVDSVMQRHNLSPQGYLLYDSGIEANKGIYELIDTIHHLFQYKRSKVSKLLVMTGGHFIKGRGTSIKANSPEAKKVLSYAKKKGVLEYIEATGSIPDNELVILFHNAQAHVSFSKIEGFNFGPVQAMASEIPSIAANLSCNPEITRGKSLLVDISKSKKTAKEIKK